MQISLKAWLLIIVLNLTANMTHCTKAMLHFLIHFVYRIRPPCPAWEVYVEQDSTHLQKGVVLHISWRWESWRISTEYSYWFITIWRWVLIIVESLVGHLECKVVTVYSECGRQSSLHWYQPKPTAMSCSVLVVALWRKLSCWSRPSHINRRLRPWATQCRNRKCEAVIVNFEVIVKIKEF